MMIHKIKINKAYADAVLSGEKPFEVRINDRGYQKGDYVEFQVMDGMLKDQGLAPNYVAFGIREVEE